MGKKKEKITYIDDGRTIADMSNVSGGFRPPKREKWTPRSSLKEQLSTFWAAIKMMVKPMLVVVVGIMVIYLVILILFSLAY
ncbi:MAG: hypothetical protein IJ375_06970 [Oscillospiraceae bacterium]|nr:hypothetical protein [Oscillospiraceae bacterium]